MAVRVPVGAGTGSRTKAALLAAWCAIGLLGSGATGADCPRPDPGPRLQVSYIYDGDTLRLADGRKVRLIGLNTPELGHEERPDEPFAQAARAQLVRLTRDTGNRIRLGFDAQRSDRYGRTLARVYDATGQDLSERMLRDGLGFRITVPPNLRNRNCYSEAEQSARRQGLGVWRGAPLAAAAVAGDIEGFRVVRGKVARVGSSRRSIWLNLKGGLALRIARDDLHWFPDLDPKRMQGRRLEARGWIYRRRGQPRMRIRHPAALRLLDAD